MKRPFSEDVSLICCFVCPLVCAACFPCRHETKRSRQFHHHNAGARPANVERDLLGPLIVLCLVRLYSFQVGLAVVSTNSVQPVPQQAHPHSVPGHAEGRHSGPCVCLWIIPLNTIRESGAVVGGRGIMSSHSIQEVVVCRHANASSPLGHGGAHAPLVGVRIEALHGPQTRTAIPTSYCKQLSIESCDSHGAARCGHTGYIVPLSGLWVPALHCVQIAPAVVASYSIHGAFQHSNTCTKDSVTIIMHTCELKST